MSSARWRRQRKSPTELLLSARLQAVGQSILSHALQPDVVALMRVVMATAQRIPQLAQMADRIGRARAVQRVAEAIAGKAATMPGAIEQKLPAAGKFIDLILAPNQMRAMQGDDPEALRDNSTRSIGDAVELLEKGGWLDAWK